MTRPRVWLAAATALPYTNPVKSQQGAGPWLADGPAGETAAMPSAYTIVDRSSGKCLEAAGGAGIRQWSWLDNTCQQWQLQPV